MDSESKTIRMRAYRIIEIRGGKFSNWIVTEDIERELFSVGSSYGGSGSLGVPKHDPSNTRNALIALREEWRRKFSSVPPINTLLPRAASDSIDLAIAQAEIRGKKLRELARQLKTGSVPEEIRRGRQPLNPPIVAIESEPTPDQELEHKLQRFEKELKDYGGGRQMKWKSKGRTPAGRTCEVLTFDGSEEILVGEKFVMLPSK
jgi:hypothetical protein